jgi:hypothetical protein
MQLRRPLSAGGFRTSGRVLGNEPKTCNQPKEDHKRNEYSISRPLADKANSRHDTKKKTALKINLTTKGDKTKAKRLYHRRRAGDPGRILDALPRVGLGLSLESVPVCPSGVESALRRDGARTVGCEQIRHAGVRLPLNLPCGESLICPLAMGERSS